MAYRAILIDDEFWILEGLLRVFPWDTYGFEIAGRFQDAEEALAYIGENPVDLVLSDIRMPEFTGLDLLEASRARGDDVEFLMISGYSEFEYVKEALRHGVLDYCLKPVKPEEAAAALARARARIDKKHDVQSRAQIERARQGESAGRLLRALDIAQAGEALRVAVFRGEDACALRDWARGAQDRVCATLACEDYCLCVLSQTVPVLTETADTLRALLAGKRGCAGLSGIAQPGQEDACIKEADMASLGRFVLPEASFFVFDKAAERVMDSLTQSFQLAMRNNDRVLTRQVLMRVPVLFLREKLGIYHAQQLWNRFAVCVPDNEAGAYFPLCTYDSLAARFVSVTEMCTYLMDVLLAERGDARSMPPPPSSPQNVFADIYEYVRQHYCEKISISDLTRQFYMNPTYCSELFKSKTGSTFSEFVTRLRMERVGEMMRNGEGSLQDIASATGYPDYFYFSKTFKKYFGISPTKYVQGIAR